MVGELLDFMGTASNGRSSRFRKTVPEMILLKDRQSSIKSFGNQWTYVRKYGCMVSIGRRARRALIHQERPDDKSRSTFSSSAISNPSRLHRLEPQIPAEMKLGDVEIYDLTRLANHFLSNYNHSLVWCENLVKILVRIDWMDQQLDEEKEEVFIGGEKGHIRESIRGNLKVLFQLVPWKKIPGCTGRYTCCDHQRVSKLSPLELLKSVGIHTETISQYEISILGRRDPIVIVPMDLHNTFGIIVYRKEADSFVHTLNAVSGFRRKLDAMGIHVSDELIWYDGEQNS